MKNQRGFSLIELLIVVAIIGIIAAIAVPNLLRSRIAANEASAISSTRTLVTANITYASTTGNGSFGTLAQMGADNLIDPVLAAGGPKDCYNFAVVPNGNTDFLVTASPQAAQCGTRTFTADASGVICVDGEVLGAAGTACPF